MAKYEALIITVANISEHFLILTTTLWHNHYTSCFHFTNEEVGLAKLNGSFEISAEISTAKLWNWIQLGWLKKLPFKLLYEKTKVRSYSGRKCKNGETAQGL